MPELRLPDRLTGYRRRPPSPTASPPGRSARTPNPSDRPLTGGVVRTGLSRVSVTATGAATMVVVAHTLGASGLGAYAAAQTLIAILMVVTTLGIEHGIVYYVSRGDWSAASAFKCSQWLALGCGLVGAGGGLAARVLVPGAFHGLSVGVTVAAAGALPFALSWLYGAYVALATDRYGEFAWPWAMQSALALGLVALLASTDGVGGAVVGVVVAHVITSVIGLVRMRRLVGSNDAETVGERRQLRRAIRFGIHGYAANSLQAVNYRLDLLILNATAAGVAVGHYAVAVTVTSLVWLLPQALADVLYPRVAAIHGRSRPGDEERLRLSEAKTLRHAVLASAVVAAGVVVGLMLLVGPVFGHAFRGSIALGLILLPGVVLLALANPLSAAVVARGRPGLMLLGAVVITPPTVAMYLLLIPALHATGAALASSISYAGLFCLVAWFYRVVTGSNPLVMMLPGRSELRDYRMLGARLVSMAGVAR